MFKKLRRIVLKYLKRLMLVLLIIFVSSSLLLVGVFRYVPVTVTTFMLYRHVEDFQQGKDYIDIKHQWVDAGKVSKYAFAAAIAAEDQKFYRHKGYDTESIMLAIDTWLDGGQLRGASTISQQVSKNLFLIPARSFLRKGFEVWFTLLIEAFWSKERILEVYLNSAEFGDHLFGIEAASQKYFNVSSIKISRNQSALLATSLPNPILFNVVKPSAYMLHRQAWILQQMTNLGY